MRPAGFIPLSLLLPTLASATTTTAAASLESQYSQAVYESNKAERLYLRAKKFGRAHKEAVFKRREETWEKEVRSLAREIANEENVTTTTTTAAAEATTTLADNAQLYGSFEATPTGNVVAAISASASTTTLPAEETTSPTATLSASDTTSSTAAASTATATATFSVKKKGVGYNTLSLTDALDIGWLYDWASTPGGTVPAGLEFVPMLWGAETGDWMTVAQEAVDNGAKYLLGFNEPDLVCTPSNCQSNLTVAEAIDLWGTNMEPFHEQGVKLVSPAVTNGGPPTGVTWLGEFLGNATAKGYHVDAIALHWYDSATNIDYFTNYLTDAYDAFKLPIWLTEFAGTGTVAEQQTFFETVIPWMENNDQIERYAAFGDFAGTFVNADGSLTDLGATYSDVTA
ncbi:hypothetical protein JCM1840_006940 [Sporobolomyces johnsonii]